jgi:hypothetical protein
MAAAKIKDSPYPLTVQYCGACSCPPEYCGWMGKDGKPDQPTAACKAWALANAPELAAKLGYTVEDGEAAAAGGDGGDAPKKGGKKEVVVSPDPSPGTIFSLSQCSRAS